MSSKIEAKTQEELNLMTEGGKILGEIINELALRVKAGISTGELNDLTLKFCQQKKVKPSFLSVPGYSYAICTGRNDNAVHGIPKYTDIVADGDIVTIDLGVYHKGYHTDSAVSLIVGKGDIDARRLLTTTKLALSTAIMQAKVGNQVGDISNAIETIARMAGFSPLVQMVGHGIGKKLHESPDVPCVGKPHTGLKLVKNMTIAIEPMITEKGSEIYVLSDGWTTKTVDGSRFSIFEHTVVVGEEGGKVLTPTNLF